MADTSTDKSEDILGEIPEDGAKEVRYFQVITIHLSDGKVVEATVPSFIEEGDELEVERIMVSEAMPLPEDMHFQKMMTPGQEEALKQELMDNLASIGLLAED